MIPSLEMKAERGNPPADFDAKVEDSGGVAGLPHCRITQGRDAVLLEASQAEALMTWLDLWLTSLGR